MALCAMSFVYLSSSLSSSSSWLNCPPRQSIVLLLAVTVHCFPWLHCSPQLYDYMTTLLSMIDHCSTQLSIVLHECPLFSMAVLYSPWMFIVLYNCIFSMTVQCSPYLSIRHKKFYFTSIWKSTINIWYLLVKIAILRCDCSMWLSIVLCDYPSLSVNVHSSPWMSIVLCDYPLFSVTVHCSQWLHCSLWLSISLCVMYYWSLSVLHHIQSVSM